MSTGDGPGGPAASPRAQPVAGVPGAGLPGAVVLGAVVLGAVPVAWALARAGHTMDVTTPWRDLPWLAALAVAEEAVFRGGLQAALLRQPWGQRRLLDLSAANACATLAFMATHLWAHAPLQALAVGPVSLLLGAAYEHRQRLALPVALHLWFNGCLYLMSAMGVGRGAA